MKLTVIPVGMLGTNCYILASEEKNCYVIDPGAQPDKLIDLLEKDGLTPKYILLTHCHYDHVGGAKKIMAQYDGLECYIGAGDAPVLTDASQSNAIKRGMGEDDFLFNKVNTVKEGDTFTVDDMTVTTIETPGHTRGGVSYVCDRLVFSGDTLFKGDVGRTDLDGGDYPTLKRSLKKLAELEGDYDVFPGHGPSTTMDYERAHNRYINE